MSDDNDENQAPTEDSINRMSLFVRDSGNTKGVCNHFNDDASHCIESKYPFVSLADETVVEQQRLFKLHEIALQGKARVEGELVSMDLFTELMAFGKNKFLCLCPAVKRGSWNEFTSVIKEMTILKYPLSTILQCHCASLEEEEEEEEEELPATPLHWASLNGRLGMVVHLLRLGASPKAIGGAHKSSALHWAVTYKRVFFMSFIYI
jgi:hypothetical protein